jgi:hypothetical protein
MPYGNISGSHLQRGWPVAACYPLCHPTTFTSFVKKKDRKKERKKERQLGDTIHFIQSILDVLSS